MVNLSGFCGADPTVCIRPTMPPAGPPTPAQAAATGYGQRIAAALYRIAAAIGCKGICPYLPTIGYSIAEGIVGVSEAEVLPGVVISVGELGVLVGEQLQQEFCTTCK
jgi:hypothetical protein